MSAQPQMRSQNLADQMVEQALAGQRRRVTGLDRWILVLRGLAALLVIPLLAVILDHRFSGLPARALAAAGILWGILILAGLIALRIRAARRRPRRLFLARDLEQTYDVRHNLLVNAVLIQGDSQAAYAEEIANRQTAAALQTARLVRPVGPLIRRSALPLVVVLLAWLLYGTLGPKSIWPSLARFLGFGLAAPTATSLEWIRPTADEDLYLDRPLEIVVATSGRPVETVRLERFDDFAQPPVFTCAMLRGIGNARPQLWRVTLAPHELTPDFRYRITAGDAGLQGALQLQEPVQLTGWEIDLQPPAYTGAPARTIRGTEVLAWAGTEAVFHLRANAPIMDPLFVLDTQQGENRTRMQIDPQDPRHATFPQRLTDSGTFRAIFRDALGRSALPGPPGRLTVRIDQPPVVAILKPSRDEVTTRVDVSIVPRVLIHAADDLGLADVSYVLERDGRATRARLTDAPQRSFELDWSLSELDLAIGEEVRLWFETRDQRVLPDGTPSPQLGRSRALVLTRSPPLEPQPGIADGTGDEGDGEGQDGEGDGDGQNDGNGNARAGGAGNAAGQGTAPGAGGAGQAPGQGGAPGPGSGQPGQQGEGPGVRGTEGGTGPPTVGDGSQPGDGEPDMEGPGGRGTDTTAGDFDEELRDFAERFGDQARAVQDQAESETAPQGESEPSTDPAAPQDPPADPPPSEQAGTDSPEMTPPAEATPPAGETLPPETTDNPPVPTPAGTDEPPPTPPPGEAATDAAEPPAAEPDEPAPEAGEPAPEGRPDPAEEDAPEGDPASAPGSEPAPTGQPADAEQGDAGEGAGDAPQQGENDPADAEPPAEALDAIREMLVQDDPLTPEDLAAAGLNPTEAAAFLEAYERLRERVRTARVIGDADLWQSGGLAAPGESAPAGPAAGVRLDVAQGAGVVDRLRRIVAPPDERPPASLEAVLDAYYRAMGELDPGRVADPDLTD